jgi:hypothetical protein
MFDVEFARKSFEHPITTAFDAYSIRLLVLSLKNCCVLAFEEVMLRGLTELDKIMSPLKPYCDPASCEKVFHLANELQRWMETKIPLSIKGSRGNDYDLVIVGVCGELPVNILNLTEISFAH